MRAHVCAIRDGVVSICSPLPLVRMRAILWHNVRTLLRAQGQAMAKKWLFDWVVQAAMSCGDLVLVDYVLVACEVMVDDPEHFFPERVVLGSRP